MPYIIILLLLLLVYACFFTVFSLHLIETELATFTAQDLDEEVNITSSEPYPTDQVVVLSCSLLAIKNP